MHLSLFYLQELQVTPLPLNHSKLTFGYLLATPDRRIAYLTDTAGIARIHIKLLTPPVTGNHHYRL